MRPRVLDVGCVLLLYAVCLGFFLPVIGPDAVFSTSGDTAIAYSYNLIGRKIQQEDGEPALWAPQLLCGMPFSSGLVYLAVDTNHLDRALRKLLGGAYLNRRASSWPALYLSLGMSAYLLARWSGLSPPAALFAGLTCMLSPYAVSLAEAGHSTKLAAYAYLPALLLLAGRFLHRGGLFAGGLLSAIVGTTLLTRHVQVVAYAFVLLCAFVVWRHQLTRRTAPIPPIRLVLLGGCVVVGLLIAAQVYFPLSDYAGLSTRGAGTTGAPGLDWETATSWSWPPSELVTLLVPSFFGLRSPHYWGEMPMTQSSAYLGILPLFLAGFALLSRPDSMTRFWGWTAIFILLASFGGHFPLLYGLLYDNVPLVRAFRSPSTILLLLSLPVGMMAARGLDALHGRLTQLGGEARRRMAGVLILALLGCTVMIALLWMLGGTLQGLLPDQMFEKDGELSHFSLLLDSHRQASDQVRELRFDLMRGDLIKLFALLNLCVAILYLTVVGRLSPRTFGLLSLVLLVMDLALVGKEFVRPVPPADMSAAFPSNPIIEFLKDQPGPFRVLPLGDEFGSHLYSVHGLHSAGGFHPARLRIYDEFLKSVLFPEVVGSLPVNWPAARMLNIRYLIAREPLPPGPYRFIQLDPGSGLSLYELPSAMPRAFFTEEIVVPADPVQALEWLRSPDFDPGTHALVDEEVGATGSGDPNARAEVLTYEARRIVLRSSTSAPSFLVLSEVYYPAGWTASIDGNPTRIFRTNQLLRGVMVPAGEHRVEFRFDPSSDSRGLRLSRLGWGLAASMVFVGFLRDRRKLVRFILDFRREGTPKEP